MSRWAKTAELSAVRALIAWGLAYPLGGFLYAATQSVVHSPDPAHSFDWALFWLYSVGWAWATSVMFGFPPMAGGEPIHNMYPVIVPTALVLFLLISKGWRWLLPRAR